MNDLLIFCIETLNYLPNSNTSLMELKVKINHLLVIGFLLVMLKLFLLKFIYLMIIPGFCILLLVTKWDFKKTLLLSLPVSIILYIYPYFLITRSLFAISPWVYFIVPALLLLVGWQKGLLKLSFNQSINLKELAFTLLPLIIMTVIYSPYAWSGNVSLTAGSNVLLFIKGVAESVSNYGVIPLWNEAEYAGSHYFYTYPPLAHVGTALLNVIPTETIKYMINLTIFALYIYMMFAVYMLLSYLGLRRDSALLGVIIMIGVPILAGEPTFSGNITMAYMFSLCPAAIYGFINIFKKTSAREVILYSICLGAFMTVYHYIGYFVILPALATSLLYIIFSRERKTYLKNSLIFFAVFALLFGAWFIRYYALSEYVTIFGWEGSWNVPLSDFGEFLSYIAATGTEADAYKQVITFTPLFFWFGFVASFLIFRYAKGKLLFKDKDKLFFVMFGLTFFLIISEIFPLGQLLPLRSNYYFVFKFWAVLVPFFALAIARVYENITDVVKNKSAVFLVILIMFMPMIVMSAGNVSSWLVETAIINDSNLGGLVDVVSQLPGRVALFGGFGPALNPAISNWTGQQMMMGYGFQRHSSRLVYENVLLNFTDASMDYIKPNISTVRLYNSFQVTGTNTILLFTCTENGINAANTIIQYPGYNLLVDDNCIAILTLNQTSPRVELVNLTKVDDSLKPLVLDAVGGYRVVMPYHNLSDEEYAYSIIDVPLDSPVISLAYSYNTDGSIGLNAKPGWLLFKEAYFPTMHAYQDGRELVIEPTYEGMTLIKSLSSSPITIKRLPHYSEVIGLLIYLVFLIGFIVAVKRNY